MPIVHTTPAPDRAAGTRTSLEFRQLAKSFGGRPALDGVTFRAARGEVTALLGPNGAGKTTAVSCATGLLAPDAGTVRVLGADPLRASAAHRARVGVMVQEGGLASGCRAQDLLRYAARLHTAPRDPAELSARLGIDTFATTLVRRLSGGQRQRLALALAVIGRPDVVFLDEPTAGMDPAVRRTVRDLIRELADDGAGVLLTTHLMDDVVGLADHVVVLANGRVLHEGRIEDVIARHRGTEGRAEVHARLREVRAGDIEALRADLMHLAERYGARVELGGGDASALEDVLVELEGEAADEQ